MKKFNFSFLLVLLLVIFTYFIPQKENKVEINEDIVIKEYKGNSKKEINDITYEDIKSVNISKKKFDRIIEYKEFMGAIQNIEDLRVLPYIKEEDIKKLKSFYKDTNKIVEYNSKNINDLTDQELKLIGLSNKNIKKIKDNKVSNMMELEELIKGDINKIKINLVF